MEGRFLEVVERMDRGEINLDVFLGVLANISGQTTDDILEEMEDGAQVDYKVLEIIEKLHSHYKIGLLSNAPSNFLRTLLNEHDLEKHFDEIVISSEVGLIKPSPEMFNYILSKMELKSQEVVFIDDNPSNVDGAQKVGINGILYTGVVNLKENLTKLSIIV